MIGCGFFAQNHLNAWKELAAEGAVLAAVCDVDAGKAEAAAAPSACRSTPTPPAARRANSSTSSTSSPGRTRIARSASRRLRAGIATIVQKPFAPSWDDCIAIVEAAEKAGVWLAVHENFRFQAPMRRVRQAIDSGAIGAPSWARISFRTGFDVYATQPYFLTEERLAIADVGIHMLDLARFFMGEVARVSCETQQRNPKLRGEDTATMLLRHERGGVSVVECTYESRRSPTPSPRRWSRSRARAVPSSSTRAAA